MDLLRYLTAENLVLADRLRAWDRTPRRGQGIGNILTALAPGARPDRMMVTSEGLMVTLVYPDSRWALVRLDYDYSRSWSDPRPIEWSQMGWSDQLNKMLGAYINRMECSSALALFDAVVAMSPNDEWDTQPVCTFAAALILTSAHPDAEAVRMMWGLGGFEALRALCEAESFDPANPEDIDHYGGFDASAVPVNAAVLR